MSSTNNHVVVVGVSNELINQPRLQIVNEGREKPFSEASKLTFPLLVTTSKD